MMAAAMPQDANGSVLHALDGDRNYQGTETPRPPNRAERRAESRGEVISPQIPPGLFASVDEAAAVFGVARSTLYKSIATGDIPSVQVAGRTKVPTAFLRGKALLPEAEPEKPPAPVVPAIDLDAALHLVEALARLLRANGATTDSTVTT